MFLILLDTLSVACVPTFNWRHRVKAWKTCLDSLRPALKAGTSWMWRSAYNYTTTWSWGCL